MDPLVVVWVIGSRLLIAGGIAFVLGRWIRQDPALAARFAASTALLAALGVAGVILLLVDGDAWLTVFFGLPAVAGACAVLLSPRVTRASTRISVGVTGVVLASAMLVVLGVEGLVCACMAFPLAALSFGAGTGFGHVIAALVDLGRGSRDDIRPRSAVAVALLLALPGAKSLEIHSGNRVRVEAVESSIRIKAPAADVWKALEEIDAVHGEKPLLLRIGLPVPVMCEMDGEGVGARRTCHFDRGRIDEVVTEWSPPHRMGLEITHWTLPGRHWLAYLGASYELHEIAPDETEVVRVTTISSTLRPAIYWRPLEHLGVRTEHDYLLSDVKQRLAE